MRRIAVSLVIIVLLVLGVYTCGTFKDFEQKAREPEVASVCDYKVAIIYRASFRTDEDFYNSVTAQVEWLRKRYKVLKVNYEWSFDMTRSLILRFAVISYKEIKNGTEKKESN